MKFRKICDAPETFILVFDAGDELISTLNGFAQTQNLAASSFKAVGALSSVRLAWFNPASKKYEVSVSLDEQVELVSLIGDIGQLGGAPVIHPHAGIARSDGSMMGGHMLHATVSPTCEMFLVEYPAKLEKKYNEQFGLNLFAL